jgi:diphthamide synthase (EF-2-diphthine--ammonia ligase)
VLTCCDERWPDVLQPGRPIDAAFLAAIERNAAIDVSGENGEYHSFVFDGPPFSHPVRWHAGEIRRANGFSQIDQTPVNWLS